jgi:hypothetical protein
MRFDFEYHRQPIADIDSSGILLACLGQKRRAFARQCFQ